MRRVREPRASPRNPRGATWEGKDAWARVVPSPVGRCDELLLQPDGCWVLRIRGAGISEVHKAEPQPCARGGR